MFRQAMFLLTLLGCSATTPIHGMMGHRVGKFLRVIHRPPSALGAAPRRLPRAAAPSQPPKAAIGALLLRKHTLEAETKRIKSQLDMIWLEEERQRIDEKMQLLDLEEILDLLDHHDSTVKKVYTLRGQSPLHYAAWFNDHEATRKFLDMGYRADDEDGDGDTPLDMAIIAGHAHITELLRATLG